MLRRLSLRPRGRRARAVDLRESLLGKISAEDLGMTAEGDAARLGAILEDRTLGLGDILANGVGGNAEGAAPSPTHSDDPIVSPEEFLENSKESLMAAFNLDTDEAWEAHKRAAIEKFNQDRENPLSPYSHGPRTIHLNSSNRVIDERAIADAAAKVPEPLNGHAARMLAVLLDNPGWSNMDKLTYFEKMAELSEYLKQQKM